MLSLPLECTQSHKVFLINNAKSNLIQVLYSKTTIHTMNLITFVLLSALCLLLSLDEKNTVSAAFGSRRQYHSYHHISQSASRNRGRKISISAPSATSSQEEIEHILRKAAQIRRRAALLDTDEDETQMQREVTQVQRKIAKDIRSGLSLES